MLTIMNDPNSFFIPTNVSDHNAYLNEVSELFDVSDTRLAFRPLLFCDNAASLCNFSAARSINLEPLTAYPWAMEFTCNSEYCQRSWIVCRQCPYLNQGNRIPYGQSFHPGKSRYALKKIKEHHSLHHTSLDVDKEDDVHPVDPVYAVATTIVTESLRSDASVDSVFIPTNVSDHEAYLNEVTLLFAASTDTRSVFRPLLFCDNATSLCNFSAARSINLKPLTAYPWAMEFKCNSDDCQRSWIVCRQCPYLNQGDRIQYQGGRIDRTRPSRSLILIKEHHCTHHVTSHEEHEDDYVDAGGFDVSQNDQVHTQGASILTESERINTSLLSVFPHGDKVSCHRREYLEAKSNGNAAEFLIQKSMLQGSGSRVSKEDITLLLRIVKLLLTSSRGERVGITDIFERIVMKIKLQGKEMEKQNKVLRSEMVQLRDQLKIAKNEVRELQRLLSSDIVMVEHSGDDVSSSPPQLNERETYVSLAIPTTANEARRLLEGPNCFVKHLPIPTVESIQGYAMTLPSNALQLGVCLGLDLEEVHCIDAHTIAKLLPRSIYQSPNIQKLITAFEGGNDLDVYHVPVGLWSDGCDTGGTSKSNRSGMKITSIHIFNDTMTPRHVFPIAIGPSKSDHEEVRKLILDDFHELSLGTVPCFQYRTKKIINVRFFLAYTVQDRPEHAEFTGFLSHAGTYSTVPGISCPISVSGVMSSGIDFTKPLASCTACVSRRLRSFINGAVDDASERNASVCTTCCDFDLYSVTYVPPTSFPPEEILRINQDANGLLRGKEVTFESMKNALLLTYQRLSTVPFWNKKQAQEYTKYECISTSIFEEVYQLAREARDKQPTPPFPEHVLPAAMKFAGLELKQCLVGVMHTLILNGGKTVLGTIRELLTKETKWQPFYKETNLDLQRIRKLSLSWCKAWNYGSSQTPGGPWVSENYYAFIGVSKSLCSLLCRTLAKPKADAAKSAIWSWTALVARIMQPVPPTQELIHSVSELVKIFLSSFGKMDSYMLNARRKPKIESTSCLASLLIIAQNMELHGIQRNFWEGSDQGEGIIGVLKPLVSRGTYMPGFATTLQSKFYILRELQQLIDETDQITEDDAEENDDYDATLSGEAEIAMDKKRYRRFHCYEGRDMLADSITTTSAIALMHHLETGKFYALIRDLGNREVSEITLEDNSGATIDNTWCFNIHISEESQPIDSISNYESAILLPLYQVNSVKYYMRTEHHKELQADGSFSFPNIFETNEIIQ